jgi:isoquinoline 1-oxidoreductase alpha subunit
MSKYTLNVNGQAHSVDVTPDTPLLWVLRDSLGLVGTKYGCGIGECGACTVHLNGSPTRACQTRSPKLAALRSPRSKDSTPRKASAAAAWNELDVPQCGYCQGRPDHECGGASQAQPSSQRRRHR